jgi:hypothetical protein
MQGMIEMEWGWKEYIDHRAFFGASLNVNFELININCEIGFGIEGFGSEVQLYFAVEGSAQ